MLYEFIQGYVSRETSRPWFHVKPLRVGQDESGCHAGYTSKSTIQNTEYLGAN